MVFYNHKVVEEWYIKNCLMRAGQERKTLMQNFDSFWEEKKMYGFDNETFLSVLHE